MFIFFFFNDTATTEIYTLSLHDALPIYERALLAPEGRGPRGARGSLQAARVREGRAPPHARRGDRKSTRLNSSHLVISYAVFCLKKKNKACESFQACRTTTRNYIIVLST